MSKSIEDYRNIVKILKLQLLKVRQENNSLSHQLGILSENQHSSFTPKIQKYKQSKQKFAQNVLVFLQLAHRCELVGVTPEMIFRIADKQRDKKVNKKGLTQIMKRLKLRFDDKQIQKLLNLLSKNDKIFYDDYLQYLSAFQINSQQYPQQSSRTWVQLTLVKFCEQIKAKYKNSMEIYRKINGEEAYFQFIDLNNFCSKQKLTLSQIQIVGVFLGLDLQNECKIQTSIFRRQIDKIYQLIEKGMISDQWPRVHQRYKGDTDDDRDRSHEKTRGRDKVSEKNIKNKRKQQQSDQEWKDTTTAGEEKLKQKTIKAKQPVKTEPKKQFKLDKGEVKTIQKDLSKGLSVKQLIQKLMQNEKKQLILRSFSLGDILTAIQGVKRDFDKKTVIKIFQALDRDKNGCVSTEELVKLWLRSQDSQKMQKNQNNILYNLLYRHLRQIEYTEPVMRFVNLGYKPEQKITIANLKQVFEKLQLTTDEIEYIKDEIGDEDIESFSQILKFGGRRNKSNKKLIKMEEKDYKTLLGAVKKLNEKSDEVRFKKLIRIKQNGKDQRQNPEQKYWQTIFTDPWACYEYCLNTASKLTSFWRDKQFGPTLNDKHGWSSIVGNLNNPPSGLPDESEIQWLSYEEILSRNNQKQTQVKFMKDNLLSTDVKQGLLGDCWYVSALSIVTNNDEYIKGKSLSVCEKKAEFLMSGIHPPLFHFFVKYGLYVFKFFKKFQPVYVVVDQLFPTRQNELLFAKSPQLDLQWVSFAQKAYAKLHHSYTNMISGDIAQGLNDLTNTLPIKQTLDHTKFDPKGYINSEQLSKIRQLTEQRQLMGCSITVEKSKNNDNSSHQQLVQFEGQKCGLFSGHAYSIIDYLDLKTKDQMFHLMRIRNPHGQGEWSLDWGDNPAQDEYKKIQKYQDDISKHYKQKEKQAAKMKEQALKEYRAGQDGQFLMNFKDWCQIFTNLFTGFTFKDKKYAQYINDSWNENIPSGICKRKNSTLKQRKDFIQNNHQYILKVQESTDILMLLTQQDGRLYRGQKYPYKQLVCATIILIFSLGQKESQLNEFSTEKLTFPNDMRVQIRRDMDSWHKFEKGRYAIFPCRFTNEKKKNQFEFRIYSDKAVEIKKLKKQNQDVKQFVEIKQQTQEKWNQAAVKTVLEYLSKNNPQYGIPK